MNRARTAPDLPINTWLTLEPTHGGQFVVEIKAALKQYVYQRLPSDLDRPILMVMANLLRLGGWGPAATVNLPYGEAVWRNEAAAGGSHHPDWLHIRTVKQVIIGAVLAGYAAVPDPGSVAPGLRTRIPQGPKLLQLLRSDPSAPERLIRKSDGGSVVVIKDEDKRPIPFDSNIEPYASLIRNVEVINKAQRALDVRLCVPGDASYKFRPDELEYRRIFSRGQINKCGRFFADYQHVIKADRKYLFVQDSATIEADYRFAHPTMAYARVGKAMPENSYLVEPLHDLCCSCGQNYEEYGRPFAKIALNMIFNSTDKRGLASSDDLLGLPPPFKPKHLLREIEVMHAPLSDMFYSGVGLEFMFMESQIAEKIMLAGVEAGIPLLSIHDSFVTTSPNREWLLDIMEMTFEEVVGVKPHIKLV